MFTPYSKEDVKKKIYLSKSLQNEDFELLLLSKVLFDEDMLEKDVIFHWYDNRTSGVEGNNSSMWKNVKSFVE